MAYSGNSKTNKMLLSRYMINFIKAVLFRVLKDVTGTLKAIHISDVVVAFMRVGYPRIKILLQSLDSSNIASTDDLIVALLDFEYHLVKTMIDKTHKSNEILVSIMGDVFLIMTNISSLSV
jgi:hypothetical protein